MRQQSFASDDFEKYRKKTRKELFLEEMDRIIPWKALSKVIKPYYPKPKGAGRRPIGIQRMLRIHFLQHWFELSDPGAEEALYDSRAMRQFVGIDLGKEPVPDETTILNFRHLMERHNLGDEMFRLVNVYLAENGLKVNRGTIVDATIIDAPTSTKNKDKARDPDMHQTRKGNQWYFGMKTHIGVDNQTKLIHSVAVTAANVHDSQLLGDLLHGEETHVWGDSAYAGQKQLLYEQAPQAKDCTQKKGSRYRKLTEAEQSANRYKSKIRSRVEHVFGVMKRQFGFTKVRYRGLEKNAQCVFTKCALVNLVLAKKTLLAV
jgi:IS5 family transposase